MATPVTRKRYWKGPHGVYVPCGITSVMGEDDRSEWARASGSNLSATIAEEGAIQELPVLLDRATYMGKYATKWKGNTYIYNPREEEAAKAYDFDVDELSDVVLYKKGRKRMERYKRKIQ